MKVNNEKKDTYLKFMCEPDLFLLLVYYNVAIFLNINKKKITRKAMSTINKNCKFLSFKGIKLSLIKVRKVIIPIQMQINDDNIIQLKFFIVLNILININHFYKYNIS